MTPQETLARNGIKLESTSPGRYYTTCPRCSHTRSTEHRKNKVLGITIGDDGSVCWGCNHCAWTGPEKGSGGGRQELTTYVYRDASGTPRFRKMRNLPGREPRFWLEQPDGRGGWRKGTKGVDTKILYRLDEVTKAIAASGTIACVEGEKDADNLWALGIAATCNAHGAHDPTKKQKPKWYREHSEQLAGANLVVLNDNDAAGYEHAETTCKLSVGIAKRVRRLDLKPHWLDMPKGADVSDWLARGHGRADLDGLIAAAPDYQPPASEQARQGNGAGNAGADDAELERLARLSALDYERTRKTAGERLGIRRLSMLDSLVKGKRAELGLDGGDDGLQGRPVEFSERLPWPEPVNGAELLDELAVAIGKYVVMAEMGRNAATLWAVHTFLTGCFLVSPRLGICSAVKGCGKTTLLDVLGCVVHRPLPTASVTPAAMFRVVESHQPTLLIDEADCFLRDNDELRGLLNSGHRRGGSVLRIVGDEHAPRAFATYSACAIALIGTLPDTLHDRAIMISLKRRKATEQVTPFRLDRAEHLEVLARKAVRWAQDHADELAKADPVMPANVINREADNWRPLIAIADVAGGSWGERARKGAQAAHIAHAGNDALLEILLADVRDSFRETDGETSANVQMALDGMTYVTSADVVAALVAIEGHPWAEFGKNGKALTQNQLARLLKPLGITTEKVGPKGNRVSGYVCAHFRDVFERYLGPEGDLQPDNRTQCDEIRTSEISQPDTAAPGCPVAKREKPNNDGPESGCPVAKGGNGKAHTAPAGEPCAVRSPEHASDPVDLCAYCGRPGGNLVAVGGDGESLHLHRECEEAWIEGRMAEEGIWRA